MEVMRLNSECMNCLLTHQLGKTPADVSEEKRVDYMQRVLRILSEANKQDSAPVIVRSIYRLQKEMFGMETDYTEIKRYYNQRMLEKAVSIEQGIEAREDPLKCAIQYAMTGNYIDFAALHTVEEDKLDVLLHKAEENLIDEETYAALKQDLERAGRLVYLTDNCGEIVLDKLLLKVIEKLYPEIQVTVIVRGGPVANDATMEDAVQTGLTDMAHVIGNGNDVGGTWLEGLSQAAGEALDQADVVISKGQGNFETLQGCGLNIYYIFMCKCSMFTKRFHVKQFDGILINDRKCREF